MSREIAALLIALVTGAVMLAALLYASREARAERRALNRGERLRRRKNADRLKARDCPPPARG